MSLANQNQNEGGAKKRTREDRKKEKELEEMRKAGTIPALVDETGKDINPHIPQYISDAPWYIGADGPTLRHQRPQKLSEIKEDYRKKAIKLEPATKFRDGACENCGAMGHQKKQCLERPRKVAAKFLAVNLAADEIILPEAELGYDGKRDRWNGFDPSMYSDVIREYEKVEEAKLLLKEEKLKEDILLKNSEKEKAADETAAEPQAVDDDNDDEDKYAENAEMPGTKVDSKQRITVRNLRIREDTAKYLRNLDPESAYYDPKTRAMRENPYANTQKEPEELAFAGDNAIRYSGSTNKVYESQVFAWQAAEKGVDVHMQAEPTKTELLNKQFKAKKEEIKTKIQQSILDKYCSKNAENSDSDDDQESSVVGKSIW